MNGGEVKSGAKYFYFLIAGVFLIVVSRAFFSDGLFMDGMMYATMAKNLSHGLGTFWGPHLTDTFFPVFINHPPLAIGLESLFFRILGDSRFVERIYSMTAIVLTAYLITSVWKNLGHKRSTAWLPLLFWIAFPTITWASVNNMLENTMGIFICLSVLFYLKSLGSGRWIFLILSGIMLTAGFLTKGPVTFFPLTFPAFYWISTRRTSFKDTIIDTLTILFSSLASLALLYIFTPAGEVFPKYLGITFNLTFNSATRDTRFYILKMFVKEIIPCLIITGGFLFLFRKKKLPADLLLKNGREALAFLFLGLSGVLPLMITRVQSGYYYMTSLAFFALSASLLVYPSIKVLSESPGFLSNGFRYFRIGSVLILAAGIILSLAYTGTINRDRQMILDTRAILPHLEENSTVSISPEMAANWSLHVYFARSKNISLDPDPEKDHEFIIVQNSTGTQVLSDRFEKVNIPTAEYHLYKKIKENERN